MTLIQWLRSQIFIPKPPPEPEPIVRRTRFRKLRITHRDVALYPETVQRLEQLRGQAIALQERVEAMANEACELCGFDPESGDCVAEIAKDIVFGCDTVDGTIDHLADVMRLREAARRGKLKSKGGGDYE
jgi:hypothetical protein